MFKKSGKTTTIGIAKPKIDQTPPKLTSQSQESNNKDDRKDKQK